MTNGYRALFMLVIAALIIFLMTSIEYFLKPGKIFGLVIIIFAIGILVSVAAKD